MRAPEETPQQNGIADRVVRSLKIASVQLLLGVAAQTSQALRTQVTMAWNHVPHTATGIAPAMETTGRSDLQEGHASTAWNRDPQSIDPAARQLNSAMHILNARNAIITDDAKRELVTFVNRNLPDRSREFRPKGSSAQ